MAASATARGASTQAPDGTPPSRFRRRRYLIDASHQVRVGLGAVGITLVLFVLLDASLLFRGGGFAVESALIGAGSLVFLAGVFVVSILETHRTSGAARSLLRVVERLREGDWRVRAQLRRRDNLKELGAAFNDLAGTLLERRRDELTRLEALARTAESDPQGTARDLRTLVEERRRELGEP